MRPIGSFGQLFQRRRDNSVDAKMEISDSFSPAASEVDSLEEAEGALAAAPASRSLKKRGKSKKENKQAKAASLPTPKIRKEFADSAVWQATLESDKDGKGEIEFKMPENLTTWNIKAWSLGAGTKVGQSSVKVVTTKNLLLRAQTPRFLVEKDEAVLSANIHNYLAKKATVEAKIELEGETFELIGQQSQSVTIEAGGETRVDWRVKALKEGEAVVMMLALNKQESDAMEVRFPLAVHGMLKTESVSGAMSRELSSSSFSFNIPKERKTEQSKVELKYSPSLAGALVDALPYLISFPYGCTEQTLNRFLPVAIVQSVLKKQNLDLEDIKHKLTNLNSQELGDPKDRAKGWEQKHWKLNPVFDQKELEILASTGLAKLSSMQLADGGWGWFSGYGENSSAHTTAYVVHGLQVAKEAGLKVDVNSLSRGHCLAT